MLLNHTCERCGAETSVTVYLGCGARRMHRELIAPPEPPTVWPEACECGAEIDAERLIRQATEIKEEPR